MSADAYTRITEQIVASLDCHAETLTDGGQRRLIRHCHLPKREIVIGIGPVAVRAAGLATASARAGSASTSLRQSCRPTRRSMSLETLIPVLYLKSVSTSDFEDALAALLRPDAGGLSASTVARLKYAWTDEHARWLKLDLSGKRYVYLWADGLLNLHFHTLRHYYAPSMIADGPARARSYMPCAMHVEGDLHFLSADHLRHLPPSVSEGPASLLGAGSTPSADVALEAAGGFFRLRAASVPQEAPTFCLCH